MLDIRSAPFDLKQTFDSQQPRWLSFEPLQAVSLWPQMDTAQEKRRERIVEKTNLELGTLSETPKISKRRRKGKTPQDLTAERILQFFPDANPKLGDKELHELLYKKHAFNGEEPSLSTLYRARSYRMDGVELKMGENFQITSLKFIELAEVNSEA